MNNFFSKFFKKYSSTTLSNFNKLYVHVQVSVPNGGQVEHWTHEGRPLHRKQQKQGHVRVSGPKVDSSSQRSSKLLQRFAKSRFGIQHQALEYYGILNKSTYIAKWNIWDWGHVLKSHSPTSNHTIVSCFCILSRTFPRLKFWKDILWTWWGHGLNFKFNVSNIFLLFSKSAGAEQHVNNLHISCNCCGQWGVGSRTTLVFCQPHTTEGHSELMVVALLLQLHFPEEFGLKTGSGSPL